MRQAVGLSRRVRNRARSCPWSWCARGWPCRGTGQDSAW